MSIMTEFDAVYTELWNKTEWAAIATSGSDGPHVVGVWGKDLRSLNGELADVVILPAAGFRETEENLKRDSRIELLIASRDVQGSHGPGQGCSFSGTGEVQTSGPNADRAKQRFSWARGALVIKIERAKLHL